MSRCRTVRRGVGVIAVGHHADGDAGAIDAQGSLSTRCCTTPWLSVAPTLVDHRARRHDGEHALAARDAHE